MPLTLDEEISRITAKFTADIRFVVDRAMVEFRKSVEAAQKKVVTVEPRAGGSGSGTVPVKSKGSNGKTKTKAVKERVLEHLDNNPDKVFCPQDFFELMPDESRITVRAAPYDLARKGLVRLVETARFQSKKAK